MTVSKPMEEELLSLCDAELEAVAYSVGARVERRRTIARALKDRLSPPAVGRDEVIEEAARTCIKLGLRFFGDGELGQSRGAAKCVEEIRALKTIRPSDNSD